jgi:hypothetical protein
VGLMIGAEVAGDGVAGAGVPGDFVAGAVVTGDWVAGAVVTGDFVAGAVVTGDWVAGAVVTWVVGATREYLTVPELSMHRNSTHTFVSSLVLNNTSVHSQLTMNIRWHRPN